MCLVLEEAHSLVPEWNATTRDDEREAVNGTIRALLQGRKYGYGCLLVTQRTANVTKSILNQCNTILGMRVYDTTGMGFLENYVGEAHAKVLASLKNRQAVFFGRASTCEAPIVIQLNDANAFRDGFWADVVGQIRPTQTFNDLEGRPVDEEAAGVGTGHLPRTTQVLEVGMNPKMMRDQTSSTALMKARTILTARTTMKSPSSAAAT